ncbi:MAG: hypothetical protein GC145_03035 [Caulobacter sp.]|nr:hypothetical protein [Caulobacter sp.]
MNDLRLHKIKGLLLLAQIAHERGLPASAAPLHELGERMAKSSHSHFALTHTSGVSSLDGR